MPFIELSNKEARELIFNKYGGRCAYCGCKLSNLNFEIDHIEALNRKIDGAKRGANTIDNFNPACDLCNKSKSNSTIEYWRHQLIKRPIALKRDYSSYRTCVRMGLIKEIKKPFLFYFEKLNRKNG